MLCFNQKIPCRGIIKRISIGPYTWNLTEIRTGLKETEAVSTHKILGNLIKLEVQLMSEKYLKMPVKWLFY